MIPQLGGSWSNVCAVVDGKSDKPSIVVHYNGNVIETLRVDKQGVDISKVLASTQAAGGTALLAPNRVASLRQIALWWFALTPKQVGAVRTGDWPYLDTAQKIESRANLISRNFVFFPNALPVDATLRTIKEIKAEVPPHVRGSPLGHFTLPAGRGLVLNTGIVPGQVVVPLPDEDEKEKKQTPSKPTSEMLGMLGAPQAGDQIMITQHAHILTWTPNLWGHSCDLCRASQQEWFRCQQCDFDLCQKCRASRVEIKEVKLIPMPGRKIPKPK